MKKRNGNQPDPVLSDEIRVPTEEELAVIEADPGLQQMARDSERAIREGRVYTHAEVKEALRKGNLKGLIEKREREWRQRG
ncbi:MAG TPA: hypothetical protein VG206_05805 [Terriglobia bacterium]|nr:hypothetical protein [Terriglobia bacterium]